MGPACDTCKTALAYYREDDDDDDDEEEEEPILTSPGADSAITEAVDFPAGDFPNQNANSQGLRLRPPVSEFADDIPGSGGCIAHTLKELGVFETVVAAKADLNHFGEIELKKRRELHGADYEAAKVYVANDKWCPAVVTATCTRHGFGFKKLDLNAVNLKDELRSGKFFIGGTQNRFWQKFSVQ